jgi:hypothetical protein
MMSLEVAAASSRTGAFMPIASASTYLRLSNTKRQESPDARPSRAA